MKKICVDQKKEKINYSGTKNQLEIQWNEAQEKKKCTDMTWKISNEMGFRVKNKQ